MDWDRLLLGGHGRRWPLTVDGQELEAYSYVPPGTGPFPVLYVLDALGTFLATVSATRTLTAIMRGATAEVAVVGVGRVLPEGIHEDFAQRIHDFSPTSPGPEGRATLPPDLPLGGAPAFLSLLTDHVMPAVEADLPVDPADRAIAGWSMSGLFACYATVVRPDLFQRCIGVSPSVWFDSEQLTQQVRALPPDALAGKQYYLCAGEHEGTDWSSSFPPLPEGHEWPEMADMQQVGARFAEAAAARGARTTFQVLEGESHGTIWWNGVTRGLVELYRRV